VTTTSNPAEAFPPGEYLRDELDEREWTITEFAEIIGRPIQAVSEILNGKKEITTDTAMAFADALGTTPSLWLNLQTNYRVWTRRNEEQSGVLSPVARRARLRELLPLAEVRKRGWIEDSDDLDQLESNVCELLDIATVADQPQFALAARRSNSADTISIEQTAWLAHVRAIAAKRTVVTFDRDALAELAALLPKVLASGPTALSSLESMFAQCGVILVFSEGLKGGKLDGAVTFLRDGRPVTALTARGDRFDSLVFTLLHESAHLVLEHLTPDQPSIIEYDIADVATDPLEIEANERAHRWLFPEGFQVESASLPAIVGAAGELGVHPSIVLGQIQRRRDNWTLHRRLIPKVRSVLRDEGMLV
jgi:HTH-type transcriptional regulator/antitoxin HigA